MKNVITMLRAALIQMKEKKLLSKKAEIKQTREKISRFQKLCEDILAIGRDYAADLRHINFDERQIRNDPLILLIQSRYSQVCSFLSWEKERLAKLEQQVANIQGQLAAKKLA